MARKNNIPLAAMERIMKKIGADRVSENAKESLRSVLESHAEELSTAALRYAQHAGRKTIKAEDIELAAK